jgi:cytochrome c oxidase subunit 3
VTRATSKAAANASVGMAVFLGALAMLFAALLLAYAVLRAQATAWPPPGAGPLPRLLLSVNTLVLVAASLALRARRGGVALALGTAFLALQAVAWQRAVGAGLGPASGAYGSVFFALSGFHALHVLGGIAALGAVLLARGARAAPEGLRLVARYWDFMLVVWLVVYAAVCVA